MSDHPGYVRTILAASAAVIRDGRVLLATRTKPPNLGIWTLPGGRVELGETLQDAAAREVWEETGVRAEVIRFLGHAEIIEKNDAGHIGAHFVIAAFAARYVSGEARPGPEAGDVRWALPQDLQQHLNQDLRQDQSGTRARPLAMTPHLRALLTSTLGLTADGSFAAL